jgi:hypothetical protein
MSHDAGRRRLTSSRPSALLRERDFREWLSRRRGLKGRSLGDVVSRLRRVASWIDLQDQRSDAEILFWLSQDTRFAACSPNVKSQLKRAVSYYRVFLREVGNTS